MHKTCQTCKQEKPLEAFWLDSVSGHAKPAPPASHCIVCHEQGLVPHGYGPGNVFKSPAALDAWLDKLQAR